LARKLGIVASRNENIPQGDFLWPLRRARRVDS